MSESDLPLDETALQAAQESYDDDTLFYTTDLEDRKQAMRAAISTYLRKARFVVEDEFVSIPPPKKTGRKRLVGPRHSFPPEPFPVVQTESEEK